MATKTKSRKRSSSNSESLKEIRRHWGDVEVVDADKNLRVFIQPEDVRSATQKDPGCCVFAQACKRQFAATKVLFWRCVAFVELPAPKGGKRVERFELSPQMRDLIDSFDRGHTVQDLAGFELKRPRPSQTFEGMARRKREANARRKEALLLGTRQSIKKGRQGEGRYSKPVRVVDLEIRNGSGRVQFKAGPAEA